MRQQLVRSNVLELLQVYPELKENYNMLVTYYWTFYDGVSRLTDVKHATPAESITRQFRKLVSSGVIDVPCKTKQVRREMEKVYRETMKSE